MSRWWQCTFLPRGVVIATAAAAVCALATPYLLSSSLFHATYDADTHSRMATWSVQWSNAEGEVSDASIVAVDVLHVLQAGSPPSSLDVTLHGSSDSLLFGSVATDTGDVKPPSGYGLPLTPFLEVMRFWRHEFNVSTSPLLRRFAQLHHFSTVLSGLRVHFVHEPAAPLLTHPTCASAGGDASRVTVLPLLLLHGWPGSVLEFHDLIPLLTTRCFRGVHADAPLVSFSVVAPSLPGYGLSAAPQVPGFDVHAAGEVFFLLMSRLQYPRFYIQGGDWGGLVATAMAQMDTHAATGRNERVVALHLNFFPTATPLAPAYYLASSLLPAPWADALFRMSHLDRVRANLPATHVAWKLLDFSGYMHAHGTRPHTIGLALSTSPAAWMAWMVEKMWEWSDMRAPLREETKFSYEWLVGNALMTWATGHVTSAIRLYKECFNSRRFQVSMHARVLTPTYAADFPGEVVRVPEPFLRTRFPALQAYTAHTCGGHFAALEEPELLANDVGTAFSAHVAAFGERAHA